MERKKILAVFFGGRSSEHEISIISALQLIKSVDVQKFEVLPVYIDPAGNWWTGSTLLDRSIYKSFQQHTQNLTEVYLLPKPGPVALRTDKPGFFGTKQQLIPFDVAIPVFHGQFGEDGCVQGLFELAAVPYSGSPVAASAVAMSKFLCKQVAAGIGVPSLPGMLVLKLEFQQGRVAIQERLAANKFSFPLFVKPNNLGSSVGVGSAKDENELFERLAAVFAIDSEALVEPMLLDMLELNIAVGPKSRTSVLEMPVASEKILTYEDKYLRGGKGKKGGSSPAQGMASLTRVIDPQEISEDVKATVRKNALALFHALGCGGFGRFDFMLNTKSGEVLFNELNPLPGSLSFYLWEKSTPKLLYPQIVEILVEDALETFALKATLKRDIGFKALS